MKHFMSIERWITIFSLSRSLFTIFRKEIFQFDISIIIDKFAIDVKKKKKKEEKKREKERGYLYLISST